MKLAFNFLLLHMKAMADELWRRHLIRNKSMIVELFQGQIKSVLKCLNCTEVREHAHCSYMVTLFLFTVTVHVRINVLFHVF